jgi:ATP-dependent exoDNAse (exonuclease V) beta subunit
MNMSTETHFSKSAVTTYLQCPEKFLHQYITKVPDLSGPEAQIGQHLHEIYNDYYKTLDLEMVKTEDDLIKHAMDYDDGMLTKQLHNFAAFNCNMFVTLKEKKFIKPVMAEEKMFLPSLNLSGLVDAVFEDGEGNCLVLDYKTGKYDSRRLLDYRLELSVYDHLLRALTRFRPTHWGILFTAPGVLWKEPIVPTHFTTNVKPVLEKMRIGMIKREFPPTTSLLCMYCSMKNICTAFGGKKAV